MTRNPYIAMKRPEPLRIERTDPQPGERYFIGHRVVRMGDPLPVVVQLSEPDPDLPYGKWGGSHPLVTWGGVGLLVFGLGLICVGMGWW